MAVVAFLEGGLSKLVGWWLAVVLLASAMRIATSPLDWHSAGSATFAPYLLLVAAPVASLFLALRWFEGADRMEQPRTRLARVGRWSPLTADEARSHRLYGTSGIMVSLMIGMLLNVPFRVVEYLGTMPAITAAAPEWLSVLHFWMTFDAVLMCSLYAVCFAAAFRKMPLFPRLLLLVWLLDIAMQLVVAQGAVATGLPSKVAEPLHALLEKNIIKVFISIGLWLPYLLLSERVNVTFRHRSAM